MTIEQLEAVIPETKRKEIVKEVVAELFPHIPESRVKVAQN